MATLFQSGIERARELAERLKLEFVDLEAFRLDYDLFHSVPQDLMVKYHFIPEKREGGVLSIIVANPEAYALWDELELLLGEPIRLKVADSGAIKEMLEKGESSQRILDE